MSLVELSGADSFVAGIEAAVDSTITGPDLVIVRDALTPADYAALQECKYLDTDTGTTAVAPALATNILRGVIDIDGATQAITKQWYEVAYSDYERETTARVYRHLRSGDSESHIDLDVPPKTRNLNVMTTASFCIKGTRLVTAGRIPETFRTSSGEFDQEAYSEFAGRLSRFRSPQEMRSRALVSAGDIAIWGQNPLLAEHAVIDATRDSEAILLEWQARRARVEK